MKNSARIKKLAEEIIRVSAMTATQYKADLDGYMGNDALLGEIATAQNVHIYELTERIQEALDA